MSHGRTELVKDNFLNIAARVRARAEALFERARVVGQSSLAANTPVDRGALLSSTSALPLEESGVIGFVLRSFGDDVTGKGYARWVNGGHNTSNGGWVAAQPYYSQAEMDARVVIEQGRKDIFQGL